MPFPARPTRGKTEVGIYLGPRAHSLAGSVQIGTMTAPALGQNDIEQVEVPLTLPSQPSGFPSTGVLYIHLVANQTQTVVESSYRNNISQAIPVRFISRALPELRVSALDVPPVMQPGDTITPTFRVTNLGTAGTNSQGPVEVALVASVTPDFNLGSSIVALYTLPQGIPGQSSTPVQGTARHHRRLRGGLASDNNVVPARNVETFTGTAVTLPASPDTYFLGIVIDPNNKLTQLSMPSNRLEQIRPVGPPIPGLPPAGVVSAPLVLKFPNPPDGTPIGNVNPASL